jgi:hypothetical protein
MLARISRNLNTSREVLGDRAVECYVSDRWLAFPPASDMMTDGKDLMIVDVMTATAEGGAKKLCELILVATDACPKPRGGPQRPRSLGQAFRSPHSRTVSTGTGSARRPSPAR